MKFFLLQRQKLKYRNSFLNMVFRKIMYPHLLYFSCACKIYYKKSIVVLIAACVIMGRASEEVIHRREPSKTPALK